MSRVISIDGPGKVRNRHRRTIAEALRRLSQKVQLDDEAKDLAALIVFSLHGMADTVDRTTDAWEQREYFLKAERFREQWRWLEPTADELSGVINEGQWDQLPSVLAGLMPHFADIRIKQMTRKPTLWQGAYERFMQED
jgi:predicted AlkP superfamily pyrophosphatase or phosphodiesterase